MSERSIEEFLAALEERAVEGEEQERELLESSGPEISAIRSAVSAVSRLKSGSQDAPRKKLRPRFCGHCGARLAAEHSFCTQCGEPVEP